MKKIIALFLITIFLCANTSIGQLLKVPNLLEHYKEHKKSTSTNTITFTQFIKLHYSKSVKDNHNHDEHQNLPFKTLDNVVSVFTFCFSQYQFHFVKLLIENRRKFFYKIFFKSSLIASIWLPPKIA